MIEIKWGQKPEFHTVGDQVGLCRGSRVYKLRKWIKLKWFIDSWKTHILGQPLIFVYLFTGWFAQLLLVWFFFWFTCVSSSRTFSWFCTLCWFFIKIIFLKKKSILKSIDVPYILKDTKFLETLKDTGSPHFNPYIRDLKQNTIIVLKYFYCLTMLLL